MLQVLSANPEMQRLTAVSIARDLWQKEGLAALEPNKVAVCCLEGSSCGQS